MGIVVRQSASVQAMTEASGMRQTHMDVDKNWHVKKEIPISTVAMFAVQLVSIVWLVATLNNRVDNIEQKAAAFAPSMERIIKLEAKVENVQDGIAEIKGILRNTTTTPNKRTEIPH